MAWSAIAAAVPAVLSVAGTAAKAGGQYKGGVAQSNTDLYRAEAGRRLAQGYDMAATRAVQGGEAASDITGLKTREDVGKAKAQQGANNVDVSGPTATAVREGIRQSGRLNQLTVLSNAQLSGWGYKLKAQQERDQADIYERGAADAKAGGAAAATGSLFSAASSLPFGWLKGLGGGGGSSMSSADTFSSATSQGVSSSDYSAIFGNTG